MTHALALPDASELDALGDPGSRIIMICERAKSWLALALEGNDIEQIREIKSQAEALRVYSLQRELGKDVEISAQEIVRRAERCIGLFIRKGQEEGRIAKVGDIGGNRTGVGNVNICSVSSLGIPRDLLSEGPYAITDGVSDEQFESALEEAKAQRNLSRANVVRHVKGAAIQGRWDRLEELANAGNTSHQIGQIVGVSPEAVRDKARKLGIVIRADVVLGHSRKKIDPNRVLGDIIGTLDALYPTCDGAALSGVDPDLLEQGLKVMNAAMPALSRLRKRIRKEVNND